MTALKAILSPLRSELPLLFVLILTGSCAAALNLSRPVLFGIIIGEFVRQDPDDKVIFLIFLFVLSWCMSWGVTLFIRYLSTKMDKRILMKLRVNVLTHFFQLPFLEHEQQSTGKLHAYITSDLPAWASLYGTVFTQVIHSIAQLTGAAIALVHFDSQFMLIITPFLLLSSFVPMMTSKIMIRINRTAQDMLSGTIETLSSLLQGSKELVSLHAEKWGISRFQEACLRTSKAEIKRSMAQGFVQVFGASTEVIAYVVVLVLGGRSVLRNEMSVGTLVSLLATIEMIFFPARNASDLVGTIHTSLAAASRALEFLSIRPKRMESRYSNNLDILDIQNLTFMFPNTNQIVIHSLTCQLKQGEIVVIIGESGSGKSTLLKLIAGLYEPTKGGIQGITLQAGTPSVVWQEPSFFSESVIDNLTLGREVDFKRIKELAVRLNMDQLVMSLPQQYETILSENGGNLSGGQRRRLALIRALLVPSPLIVLDEPTAGLDMKNAQLVWEAISTIHPYATKIITTHRLEETKNADRVLILENGRLIEEGSPDELLRRKGQYWKLINEA